MKVSERGGLEEVIVLLCHFIREPGETEELGDELRMASVPIERPGAMHDVEFRGSYPAMRCPLHVVPLDLEHEAQLYQASPHVVPWVGCKSRSYSVRISLL